MALYREGLLNDNLLPLHRERMTEEDEREQLPSMLEIPVQFNPWVDLAKAWSYPDFHQTVVSVYQQKEEEPELSMVLTTPMMIPINRPFPLYWDTDTTYVIRLEHLRQAHPIGSHDVKVMREISCTLLRAMHSDHIAEDRTDFVVLFAPDVENDQLGTWLTANGGRRPALEDFLSASDMWSSVLVRSVLVSGTPHIFHRWLPNDAIDSGAQVELECSALPRRRNFLYRGTLTDKSSNTANEASSISARKVRAFPAESCTFDRLSLKHARFGIFVPAILQHIEVLMVADRLCQTVLKDVSFRNVDHAIAAISAPSAHWVTNYERYEFLGDSLLKFIVSSQLFADYPNWHEGYLTEQRNSFVSNSRLAKAALDNGLDAFILTKSFASRKWDPPLISELVTNSTETRNISSKVLADVVEALVGAAFIDGDLSSARACIHTFLPDIHTTDPKLGIAPTGGHSSRKNAANVLANTNAELLVGHQFRDNTLLVEALTHPSCDRDTITESYQRLEYLGDAVLDVIVVTVLFEHNLALSQGKMSAMKAALVNADFLAFLCMDVSLMQDTVDIQQHTNGKFNEVHGKRQIELWKFMRHHSQDVMKAQQACHERYRHLRQDVKHCLQHGEFYPWALLAELNADKFYSDLVESILGAIFVDSEGGLGECQSFAERVGILPYLRRLVEEGVEVCHPKTALERLTGSHKVEYVVECEENARNGFRCLVRVQENEVVAVKGCLTKNEAVVKAADAAVELILRTTVQA